MGENADTAKGVIDRVVKWQSGKGYFLNFSGDETDYYGFGPGNYRPGTFAEFETKDGTGKFNMKVQLMKLLNNPDPLARESVKGASSGTQRENVQKDPVTTHDTPTANSQSKEEKEIDNALNVYCDKNRNILEQSCMKAAARIVARLYPRSENIDWGHVAEVTCNLKNEFVVSILSQGDTDETAEA